VLTFGTGTARISSSAWAPIGPSTKVTVGQSGKLLIFAELGGLEPASSIFPGSTESVAELGVYVDGTKRLGSVVVPLDQGTGTLFTTASVGPGNHTIQIAGRCRANGRCPVDMWMSSQRILVLHLAN
jgi:hypothetical protein